MGSAQKPGERGYGELRRSYFARPVASMTWTLISGKGGKRDGGTNGQRRDGAGSDLDHDAPVTCERSGFEVVAFSEFRRSITCTQSSVRIVGSVLLGSGVKDEVTFWQVHVSPSCLCRPLFYSIVLYVNLSPSVCLG